MIYDALGSILSRILHFEYVWFTIGSFILYGLTTFYLEKYSNYTIALAGSFLIGVFDATIGILIAKKLKANIREEDLDVIHITPNLIFYMGTLATVIGVITLFLFS